MYPCNKFVSQCYLYIQDEELGLCHLKLSSYRPFPCEFYVHGHSRLRQQLDRQEVGHRMMDNPFVEVGDVAALEALGKNFQPSVALCRIDFGMRKIFRFSKGNRSTR